MKCYCLCVLRWLMRPIVALNGLLQIEQERSEEESSVGDALAMVAFLWARFCSASLILSASYSSAPLLIRPRYFAQSCGIFSHDSVGMLKSLGRFWGVFVSLLLTTKGAFSHLQFSIKDFLWQTFIRHSDKMACQKVCTLCPFRTSVSGILSCHLIFRSLLRQRVK